MRSTDDALRRVPQNSSLTPGDLREALRETIEGETTLVKSIEKDG